jgi:hypothetical protein
MKGTLSKLADSTVVLGVIVLLILGYGFYSRNGAAYFSGTSGGAYWDHRKYCETHPDGRIKIYSQLVPCRAILQAREYCARHLDGSISLVRETLQCDAFLGVQDDHSPWDAF